MLPSTSAALRPFCKQLMGQTEPKLPNKQRIVEAFKYRLMGYVGLLQTTIDISKKKNSQRQIESRTQWIVA